jgi:hypothetical protein
MTSISRPARAIEQDLVKRKETVEGKRRKEGREGRVKRRGGEERKTERKANFRRKLGKFT